MRDAKALVKPARHVNHLIHEKSPYLLQHAHNPVDWFPWSEVAFAKARAEDKPIFLSIGYSTCHWCHVMERESFEDESIGAFLNEHFVNVKVDREERPDVDKIYMSFVQATTGSGGWPLSVFLTPDRQPFFGGTYFPPKPAHGRPSFHYLLQRILRLWREQRPELLASARQVQSHLADLAARETPQGASLTSETLHHAVPIFSAAYDAVHGGFGDAPKFPQPSIPSLLLRASQRFNEENMRQMALHTCDAMAAGGIHDQLGGGFSRYAVDAQWQVPHFEKMLYDNAQLAQLYLDAFLVSGKMRHADVVRDILDYVLHDMTHPEGGFYSAEDADSEGHEGKFYCWTFSELSKLLSVEEFSVTTQYFGVTKNGNFVDHSHPSPLLGQNVLRIANPNVAAADQALLAASQEKMRTARAQRERPRRDDKILASWNGLMLGAFARAGIIFDEKKYRLAAAKNFHFLCKQLWDETTKTLHHRWCDGQRDTVQLLETYAYLLAGVVDFYEATLQSEALDFAVELAEVMLAKFYDSNNGGFWQSPADASDLIVRVKDGYDGAEPSGNSVATLALLKLAAITGRSDFQHPADATLRFFADRLLKQPTALATMLHTLDFSMEEPTRIVITGDASSKIFHALLHVAHSIYCPNKVILSNTGAVESFAQTLPTQEGTATAFVCTGVTCQPGVESPNELKALLHRPAKN